MSEQGGEQREAGAGTRGLRRHAVRWTLLLLASLFSGPQALALGLGQAQVQSYLQQPLVARIDLISRSEAEMATVTAGLASPADFQVLGLTRAAIATPLEFEIYRDLSDPHIRVTSRLPMNEPVVQLVVEVVWASGRMLRQYTLFLDPPTFDAPAPLPAPSVQRSIPRGEEFDVSDAAPAPETRGAPADSVSLAGEDSRVEEPESTGEVELSAAEPMPSTQERDLPIPSSDPVPDLPAADADSLGVADVSTEVPPAGPPFEPLPGLDATAEAEATDTSPVDDFAAVAPAVAAAGESAPMESTEPFPAPESIDASEPVSSAEPVEAPERVQDPVPAALPEELPVEVAKEPAEPVLPPESAEAMAAAPAQPYRAVLPEPGQPLPDAIEVQRGDTLWGLSGAYAEAQGVSINQVMLAVQQKNRDAFIEDNINAMMAGQVLRMPTREEMVSRSARDAMLEVLRQESLYRTRWDLPPSPDALPTISNLADAGTGAATNLAAESPTDAALPPATAEAEAAEEDSRLVLVPPSEDDSQASQGMGQGGSGETGISTGESVVEELARAREELANAEQENAYLEERLAELEAELARREAGEDTGGVADTNLAEMEDRLRDERLAGEEEPELAMPPRESSWLSSYGPALAGLLVLALATLVWFLRSRRDPEFTVGMEAPATPNRAGNGVEAPPSNANGAESDDPETLLDLARAYMAMGKNTQARDCIEAVTRSGTPAQVREARTMLAEL